MNRVLERVLKVILWSALSLVVLAASLIVLNEVLSGHDNLAYGIERISGLTGYPLTAQRKRHR